MFTNLRLAPTIVSTIVVVGFIIVLVLLIVRPVALEANVADLLKILTGTLAAKFGDVVMYHIGSSSGSKEKDDMNKALLLNQKPAP